MRLKFVPTTTGGSVTGDQAAGLRLVVDSGTKLVAVSGHEMTKLSADGLVTLIDGRDSTMTPPLCP